jgi:hypothetical protein
MTRLAMRFIGWSFTGSRSITFRSAGKQSITSRFLNGATRFKRSRPTPERLTMSAEFMRLALRCAGTTTGEWTVHSVLPIAYGGWNQETRFQHRKGLFSWKYLGKAGRWAGLLEDESTIHSISSMTSRWTILRMLLIELPRRTSVATTPRASLFSLLSFLNPTIFVAIIGGRSAA